jgi:hypothetical protein
MKIKFWSLLSIEVTPEETGIEYADQEAMT